MSEDLLKELGELLGAQVEHPVFPVIQLRALREKESKMIVGYEMFYPYPDPAPDKDGCWRSVTLESVAALYKLRSEAIKEMREDPYHFGWEAAKWDAFDWETVRLRVANPGVPIRMDVWGGNGSGKTVGCSARMAHCAVESQRLDGAEMLIWCFALNQNNSQTLQQTNMYKQFPREYRATSGKPFKRNAAAGMTFTAGKFTDNQFSLPNGTKCEYRFYGDNSDLERGMEGPRPFVAWADEEIPLPWIGGIMNRLLTMAGKTKRWHAQWVKMLEEKRLNPAMKFPREKWHELYCGVLLVSFTCKGGFTPAVRAISKGGTVVRQIEAEMLPIKNAEGEVTGYEKVPELIRAKDGKASAMVFFPWENVFGGNWEGMKKTLEGETRRTILWKGYGMAEESTDVVFPMFHRAAHLLMQDRLPAEGTWYHVLDPTDAKRNWVMVWIKISREQVSFLAREWPQEDDFIPGIGKLGEWAVPSTGKRFDGDRGPAQKRVIHSYEDYAKEIERVEAEIEALEMKLHKRSDMAQRHRDGVIRIMDARAGNTDSMSHSSSETPIEAMMKHGYFFRPSGKAGGGEGRIRSLDDRSQFVDDLLNYDREKVVLNEELGVYDFKGKQPLLRVANCCTNTIFAFENWTNNDGNEGACKDFMDVVGYYAIARPQCLSGVARGFVGGGSF